MEKEQLPPLPPRPPTQTPPTQPTQKTLRRLLPHQRALWHILKDNYPGTVAKQLGTSVNLRDQELHYLYATLMEAQHRVPAVLYIEIQSLPDGMADKIVALMKEKLDLKEAGAAAAENQTATKATDAATTPPLPEVTNPFEPGSPANVDQEVTEMPAQTRPKRRKFMFWDGRRELFWLSVLKVFEAGCIGEKGTLVTAPPAIVDFRTLHILWRLDMEEQRVLREGGISLRDPNHQWYHSTNDDFVEQWVRRLRSFMED